MFSKCSAGNKNNTNKSESFLYTNGKYIEKEIREAALFTVASKKNWFIAIKRHHEHSNSYKGKYLIGGWLTAQRISSLSSW